MLLVVLVVIRDLNQMTPIPWDPTSPPPFLTSLLNTWFCPDSNSESQQSGIRCPLPKTLYRGRKSSFVKSVTSLGLLSPSEGTRVEIYNYNKSVVDLTDLNLYPFDPNQRRVSMCRSIPSKMESVESTGV